MDNALNENEEKIDCISPNTGASFDQWLRHLFQNLEKVWREYQDIRFQTSLLFLHDDRFFEISNLIEANRDELEKIIINEVGKTRAEAAAEIDYSESFCVCGKPNEF